MCCGLVEHFSRRFGSVWPCYDYLVIFSYLETLDYEGLDVIYIYFLMEIDIILSIPDIGFAWVYRNMLHFGQFKGLLAKQP